MADLNIPDAPVVEGATHLHSGKVRDLYRLGSGRPADGRQRPDLGLRLRARHDRSPTRARSSPGMSLWWFDRLADLVPNHVGLRPTCRTRCAAAPWSAAALTMFPVECVARGYLTGSGLARLPRHRRGLRHRAPARARGRLPAARADLHPGHQGGARRPRRERLVRGGRRARSAPTTPRPLRELTLAVYGRAEEIARERGIILADTKLEFGRDDDGHGRARPTRCSPPTPRASGRPTSGSPAAPSRRTTSRSCATGSPPPESGWDRASGEPPPPLPPHVVERDPCEVRRGLRAADRGDLLMRHGHASTSPHPSRTSTATSPTPPTAPSGSPASVASTTWPATGRSAPPGST